MSQSPPPLCGYDLIRVAWAGGKFGIGALVPALPIGAEYPYRQRRPTSVTILLRPKAISAKPSVSLKIEWVAAARKIKQ
jgi:hypothetical protein